MSEKEIMYFNGQPIKDTIVYVNGELSRKSEAKISIYGSGFQNGDGVYEGISVYDNRIFMLDENVKRLYESCKSLDINIGVTREEMKEIVKKTGHFFKIFLLIEVNLYVYLQCVCQQ